MIAYLLDAHILLWSLFDDKRLDSKVKNLIANRSNYIFVSTASIWEIIIKKSLNKLKSPDNLVELLEENNIEVLSVDIDHVLYVEKLPQVHKDTFDRLLIAQCIVEDLILVTSDEVISEYKIKCF